MVPYRGGLSLFSKLSPIADAHGEPDGVEVFPQRNRPFATCSRQFFQSCRIDALVRLKVIDEKLFKRF